MHITGCPCTVLKTKWEQDIMVPNDKAVLSGHNVASPTCIFRGARISSLPTIRAPLKMPAGEARHNVE